MPGTITLGDFTIPFDEEIFAAYLDDEPDLVTNALTTSGILVEDGYIGALIAGGSNTYTMPFYGALADDADDNYDGKTDITLNTMGASYQTGVVYGRAHGWYADDFVNDFTVANPLAAIAARVAKYWQNKRQARIIGIADAVLGVSEMSKHTVTKTTVGETLLSDVAQEIWGDRKGLAALAVMHSAVAQSFEDLERVEYLKHTDANGVTRDLPIYTVNGITAIIDDGVPKTAASGDKAATYTTYLFQPGALRHASAPVAHPTFLDRDELKRGGMEFFGNRFRETIHPNGFSYALPKESGKPVVSPTDAQLGAKANWSLANSDHKMIPFAKLITPGHEA